LDAAARASLGGFPVLHAQLLFNRGIKDGSEAEAFLRGEHVASHDFGPMRGISRAVDRILEARGSDEQVVVYGDFDADGVTATAILLDALERAGLRVTHYIPGRFEEGYGLNARSLEQIRDWGTDLVITVDCGIRAAEEARLAKTLGMDLIITDHHEPGEDMPEAMVIVNPRQPGDEYPFKDLSGAGLAYKLARALHKRVGLADDEPGLDLVALGTVADVSPLLGENRELVIQGLERINSEPRPGIRALMKVAGLEIGGVDARGIGFGLGPRLNAAGRMGSAEVALELLRALDREEAAALAFRLNEANRQRRAETARTLEQAREIALGGRYADWLLFAEHADFSEGIVGLVASRLSGEFYRPAVVAHRGRHVTRGSARSIPEVHITQILERCGHLLSRFGGHSQAAGFRAESKNLPALKEAMAEAIREDLSGDEPVPSIAVDAQVTLDELDDALMDFCVALEPTGEGNRQPLFLTRGARIVQKRTVGKEGRHLKMSVSQGRSFFDTIGFGLGENLSNLNEAADMVFHFELNTFRGVTNKQLRIVDVRPSD
jgi:single-stranded-DNA-specific exonuclease